MASYFFFQAPALHYSLAVQPGIATAQGQNALLSRGYPLVALLGAATANGQSVDTDQQRGISATPGQAVGQGSNAILLYTSNIAVSTDESRIMAIDADFRIVTIETDDRKYAVV